MPLYCRAGSGYAMDVVHKHPFDDGNKRSGFAALFMFPALNGAEFEPPEVDATMPILRFAASETTEEEHRLGSLAYAVAAVNITQCAIVSAGECLIATARR
jgi:prophage maintenance system killer protein